MFAQYNFNMGSQTHINNTKKFPNLYYLESDELSHSYCLEDGKCLFQNMKGNIISQGIAKNKEI